MIEVTDLQRRFGAIKAVDGLTFRVRKGELFGLLGPNGAGKTTTISMLSTQLRPTSGSARVAGYDVTTDGAAVRRRIGVVPQEIALYEDLNAKENLQFFGQLYGLGGRGLASRVDELLELAELQSQARQLVKTFSGGMKRRLNLVIGLIHAPELLFLDEPTVGIDAQARLRILDMIRSMNHQGMTVLYTTHYLEEAEQLCDRIAVIDKGELAALGDRDDLISQVGDVDMVRFRLPEERMEEFVALAADWPDCFEAEIKRNKIELRTTDGVRMLKQLEAWLQGQGLELQELEVERPNLETLYMNLTGRELRE